MHQWAHMTNFQDDCEYQPTEKKLQEGWFVHRTFLFFQVRDDSRCL